jgi:hypothetical protein
VCALIRRELSEVSGENVDCGAWEGKVLRRIYGAKRETEEKCKMSSLMICTAHQI